MLLRDNFNLTTARMLILSYKLIVHSLNDAVEMNQLEKFKLFLESSREFEWVTKLNVQNLKVLMNFRRAVENEMKSHTKLPCLRK